MSKLNTRKALSPAYRKHKPLRQDINQFTSEFITCLKTIKDIDIANESEEHIKEPLKTFFHNTFYKDNYINTKNRIDLAIYLGNNMKSDVGVIIETKKPSNKAEFLSTNNLNKKALHELLLYYLRERIDEKNNNIKHLIATNGYEWYLFKAEDFYNHFYTNKSLRKEYEDFRDGKKDSLKNELFYNEIADKYITLVEEKLPYVYLDFTKKPIKDYNDTALNTLYKIFSDVHLLGANFGNDSNQLNKSFYNELLHIIGLEEVKEKGKKLIQRKPEEQRDYGSILENTIFTIEDRDYLSNIKSVENGSNKAFNAGLELTLSWINRILFLKLLESQLISYHNKTKEYSFLNSEFIKGFDDLNDLFFSALAKKPNDRHPKYKDRFQYIPYLNSSLFERTQLENEAFTISALHDEEIEISKNSVLKDLNGKTRKGKLYILDYLFRFLDAYDFTADGAEGIEENKESKTLINASVLGLIFEKINGYKEGSFYTPAYITMYMSRETIRRAVLQKFKEQENIEIETFEDLKNYTTRHFKAEDLLRFNHIINSIRIVDPAVGSGHFLVSALNELISIKSELKILIDENGNSLRSEIIIDNDELFITDEHGHLLDYKPDIKATAIIQKTLFHEKQNLIENSLFGVDINPNSVKICRLRLWIELLKNAYYTEEMQLQTLPNIDINIKTGNSLISRFKLEDDLEDAFKGSEVKHSFTDYKNAVAEYKTTNNKSRKKEILSIINEVKNNFKSTLDNQFLKTMKKAEGAYLVEKQRLDNLQIFGEKIKKADKDNLKKLKVKADKALAQKEEIINNKIYHNAFEWRFEFPEVLDENGKYIGFDVVIGNPPYLRVREMDNKYRDFYLNYYVAENQLDLFHLFIEQSHRLLNINGHNSFIVPNTFLANENNRKLRYFILENYKVENIIDIKEKVFEDASVEVLIYLLKKSKAKGKSVYFEIINGMLKFKHEFNSDLFLNNTNFNFSVTLNEIANNILVKIKRKSKMVDDLFDVTTGIKEYQVGKGKPNQTKEHKEKSVFHANYKKDYTFLPEIRGKNLTRYAVNWNNTFISYGEWLAEPRQAHFFEGKKILIRQIPGKRNLILSYLEDKFIIDQTIYIAKLKDSITDFTEKTILALLNSKLVFWYFSNLNNEFDSLFPKIKTKEFRNLPVIEKISSLDKIKLSDKVTQILAIKKTDPKTDTTTLEKEIDQMVYQLYELTEEEIAIVEGEVNE
ncbi:Eco57I restriction-modification methylase domain-containing protein [Lentimicrobium sp. S6]|uniref:type IIG restriction enzyme/methyltransferase n=1 Tax=Lentimicrobium sp. S6 TaxID=2735872 RepID=UPI0015539948|nr:TaqI-like C-terminal specificity domain-containing protein [Lentimicrobium sp. S6]NPD47806.1 N-6 DNA methylase [Lentimicrobium sp. S6]